MRKTFSLILVVLLFWILVVATWWWCKPIYVGVSNSSYDVVSEDIKRAIYKMGPGYEYRILPGKELQVNRGDGEWLRLHYERR
jgi:hypothetical protein